ncbi:MAG: ABC transporter substrate-binding protein [Beijerinckiaceae bacterium]
MQKSANTPAAMVKTLAAAALLIVAPTIAHAQLVIGGENIAGKALFEAAKKEGQINIYGAWPPSNQKTLSDAFTKDTGIRVSFVRATSGKLYPRILAEFAAGRLNADYVDLTDLTFVKQLVRKGVLNVPYKPPSWDKLSPKLKDPQGRWFSFIRLSQVIGVNKAIVKPEDMPKGFADLLLPRWKGKIGMPSIDAGGSSFALQAFLKEEMGKDFWQKLKAQNPRIYPSVAPSVTDMVRGETQISLAGASTVIARMKAGAPVALVFPKEGVPVFPLTGGITVAAKHPNAAKLYINYITSKRGGDVIATTGNYSINPDAKKPDLLNLDYPAQDKLWTVEADHWEKVRDTYSKEWRSVFGTQ